MTAATDAANWHAILERLADDVDRLAAAYDDPHDLAAVLLAGVGRTPPRPGSTMPVELRDQAEAVLGRMHDLERLVAAAHQRLAREVHNQPDTPAYYLDTKA